MDRPRIRVDFNELVQKDLVLLSQIDEAEDSAGNKFQLVVGLPVSVYEFNDYDNGEKEYLLADGVAELNNIVANGEWARAAKWCCRISDEGIRVEVQENT